MVRCLPTDHVKQELVQTCLLAYFDNYTDEVINVHQMGFEKSPKAYESYIKVKKKEKKSFVNHKKNRARRIKLFSCSTQRSMKFQMLESIKKYQEILLFSG